MERRDGMEWPDARASEAKRLQGEIEKWLQSKGRVGDGPNGRYEPPDGSKGVYVIDHAVDGDRTWWLVRLDEQTDDWKMFSASVSVTAGAQQVFVYITLGTGWATEQINPLAHDPKCPKLVRTLLDLPGRWYRGLSTLRRLQLVAGFEAGEALAAEIEHRDRTVPIVVLSRDQGGQLALPELDSKIALDLAGLANVFVVDEDASWALTDAFGAPLSCYRGSMRLYWPQFANNRDGYSHPVWTAQRLRSIGNDLVVTRERFRRDIRRLVFRASALSVVRPHEIDDIRNAVARRALDQLRQRAASLEDYHELADTYAKANDTLKVDCDNLRSRVEDLQAQVVKLENTRRALLLHLDSAKARPSPSTPDEEIMPEAESETDINPPPQSGEVRYYKKRYNKDGAPYDVVERVQNDCGHNSWQRARGGEKAMKGIARFESGRGDWRTIDHCGSCTGGGLWRVRW
ncbi:MAG TPA: hypothetical protein VFF06_20535 [Polyangia bacterium]|nr:hypothetical protein [Polyangia bacterium]